MDKPSTVLGPYRATRLWNDIIRTFRTQMPIGRHRRHMRTFDNCFVASDGVDWLHGCLVRNPNFGPEVTRSQTIQLLDKFSKAGVFEEVKTRSSREPFEDNGRLYRFTHSSPIKSLRTPLSTRTNTIRHNPNTGGAKIDPDKLKTVTCVPETGIPQCRLVAKKLTNDEIEEIWKTMYIARVDKVLGMSCTDGILNDDQITTKHIIHNMTLVSKNGVVSNIKKEDQLPHWVMSAMKCLAQWPDRIEEGLPNYPGFERDVFKVVQDYFKNLQEPLVTFQLYDVFANILLRGENLNKCANNNDSVDSNSFGSRPGSSFRFPSRLASFGSVENLLMNMTMNAQSSMLEPDTQPDKMTHHPSGASLELSKINAVPERDSISEQYDSSPRLKFETAFFGPDNEAVTRVYETRELFERQAAQGTSQPSSWFSRGSIYSTSKYGSTSNFDSLRNVHTDYNSPDSNIAYAQKYYSTTNLLGNNGNNQEYVNGNNHIRHSQRYYSTSDVNKDHGNHFQSGTLGQRYANTDSLSTLGSQDLRFQSTNTLANEVFVDDYGYQVPIRPPRQSITNPPRHNSAPGTPQQRHMYNQGTPLSRGFQNTGGQGHYQGISSNQYEYQRGTPPVYKAPPRYNTGNVNHQPVLCGATLRDHNINTSHNNTGGSSSSYHSAQSHLSGDHSLANISNQSVASTPDEALQFQRRLAMPYRTKSGFSQRENELNVHLHETPTNSRPSLGSTTSLYSPGGHSRIQESLQMACLLIPPANRRKLHLLFRLMTRMSENPKLQDLEPNLPTRSLMLQTFTRCIIRSEKEADLDEQMTLRLVTFLLDNYSEILKVPEDFKLDTENKIAHVRRSRIMYSSVQDKTNQVTYCEQISQDEYESQKLSSSQLAIASLLDDIINHPRMSEKDKKKKLKQFKLTYPAVYERKFPTHALEKEALPKKPKIKKPLLITQSLSKLKAMRF
ncbi:unnamed protein product [Owenia fusiformis]|uniref:Uncharacterized protein n=1 Tax=Owenia fusiformis TaxID=6347 RepID=A0A8J1UCT8_OWEFU|nr:unnamed protein product [Owenia fusiformis]